MKFHHRHRNILDNIDGTERFNEKSTKQNTYIFAVVVTYFPTAETFLPLMTELLRQTNQIIVVDNSDAKNDDMIGDMLAGSELSMESVSVIRCNENLGIAAALNIGIKIALREGCSHILLSDQDSLPSPDMVVSLLTVYKKLSLQGIRVAAVGPTFINLHTGINPFHTRLPGYFYYKSQLATKIKPNVDALYVITSGALIPSKALKDVGLMREDFFIDQVDIEWCFRARAKGYRVFGTEQAIMHHRMGDSCLRVWYGGWRQECEYSPLRIYYQFRNFLVLWQMDYIDWRWKLRRTWYFLGVFYSHFFFSTHRLNILKMAFKGICHGLRNKLGRYKG